MARAQRTFTSDFRLFFIKGLGILLPTVLTLWILWMAFQFVFTNVAQPINRAIRAGVVWVVPAATSRGALPQWAQVTDEDIAAWRASPEGLPVSEASDARARTLIGRERLRTFWNERWYLSATGFIVAIVLIYMAGVLLGGLIGRRLYTRVEGFLARVPGFKQVYPHVKQVVEMVIGDRPIAFNRVVLVEYPRKGIWTVGFVTSNSMMAVHKIAGKRCLGIFIPTSPAPFTGFTINVIEDEAIDLPITIEEAVRMIVTGGVLVPTHQLPGPPLKTRAPELAASDAARED